MKDVAIIMYSHSDYSDVWQMFFGQTKKYIPENAKKYIIADKNLDIIPEDWILLEYDDNLDYAKRVSSCLERVEEEFCIFHHEDMPLYNNPNLEKINNFKKILSDNEEISYIKFLRGGLYEDVRKPELYKDSKDLFLLNPDGYFLFAVQPTLWKTKNLENLYKTCQISHIREFEPVATEICRYFKIKGLYYYGGENKRGDYHWDSDLYPYVATAIVKGKWNVSEYYEELIPLIEEYKINVYERGIV